MADFYFCSNLGNLYVERYLRQVILLQDFNLNFWNTIVFYSWYTVPVFNCVSALKVSLYLDFEFFSMWIVFFIFFWDKTKSTLTKYHEDILSWISLMFRTTCRAIWHFFCYTICNSCILQEIRLSEILSASDVWKNQHKRIVEEITSLNVQTEDLKK